MRQFKLNATKTAGYRTDKSIICFYGALFNESIVFTKVGLIINILIEN